MFAQPRTLIFGSQFGEGGARRAFGSVVSPSRVVAIPLSFKVCALLPPPPNLPDVWGPFQALRGKSLGLSVFTLPRLLAAALCGVPTAPGWTWAWSPVRRGWFQVMVPSADG